MATPTPEEMASWPEPNYDNPESRGPIVIGLTAPTLALLTSIPVSAFALASVPLGLGLHIWDLKPEWAMPYYKMAWASDILFPISCSVTKISLCLTYLRLFPSRSNKIFCWALSIFVTLYTVTCVFLMLFQCTPIRGYWDVSVKQSCINLRATLVSIAALNSVSDFLVYLWPAKPLWTIQLPLKQRLGLIFIFAIGSTVCIAGALRMHYLEVYFNSYDVFWHASIIYAVMAVEMNLGIICGCLSGVKPVLAVVFPRFFASSYKTNTHPRPTYGHSTHPESFPFQPLSDTSNLGKVKAGKLEHAVSIEAIHPEDKQHRNYAWASSSGDVNPEVPHNAIAVNQVVMINREAKDDEVDPVGSSKSGKGDGGSEEWIMEPDPPIVRR
ncbi:hypothetical protein K469DRAFT_637002 [Zopfia rhizophila CBS 207.26]|uniref:Rhodopsin domain-containing protein n=1 Tax=Zopfia rhizophila CBS 207.26 TaxID=1314779 RepID=A0A6A6DUY1_9PEZI|nr:hypothetical protein K469DRAFT_637002 [Zopfia rhizophila CBS 207.26]